MELDDGTVLDGDAVVITTGATPRRLPGTEDLNQRDGLFTLRTLDDSVALRAAVTAVDSARVVVIGAGFIGAEVASTCVGLGARVTVLEVLDIPLGNVLGPMLGAHCGSLHGANGVELRTGVAVQHIRKAGAAGAGAGDGLVVEARGRRGGAGRRRGRRHRGRAGDRVARRLGPDPGERGGVRRQALRRGRHRVGRDIARWNWRHDGGEELIRIEHWQVAAEAGVAAARSVVGGRSDAPLFVPIPYFWSDQYGIRFQVLGNPGGDDEVEVAEGSLGEGKFVALFGRAGRLRAVMAIGMPRQFDGLSPTPAVRLQLGCGAGPRPLVAIERGGTCSRAPPKPLLREAAQASAGSVGASPSPAGYGHTAK